MFREISYSNSKVKKGSKAYISEHAFAIRFLKTKMDLTSVASISWSNWYHFEEREKERPTKRDREKRVCVERADYISPSPHMPDCVTAKCPRDGGMEEGSE